MHPRENPDNWVCECGERCQRNSAEWRWSGNSFQHHHGYPIGHVEATLKPDAVPPVAPFETSAPTPIAGNPDAIQDKTIPVIGTPENPIIVQTPV